MATVAESTATLFEEAYDNLRKTAESTVEMQQDMFRQWAKMWPGLEPPEDDWMARIQQFQKDWASTVNEMTQKHQETLEGQYRAGIESLDEAFRAHVVGSADPEEMRDRSATLCRNALELMKDTSETQMKQFQEVMSKWIERCQTKP